MGWITVNAILAVVVFTGIIGVMAAGIRWQARTDRAEAPGDHRRRPLASVAAEPVDWDAEMATLSR